MKRKHRIMFFGDVHANFSALHKAIEFENPDAVVVAGDFGYWFRDGKLLHQNCNRFNCPVYFVDGNHEHHDNLTKLVKDQGNNNPINVGNNVFYIPRGCIFNLFGYNILGIGGGYSIDRSLRIFGVSWFEQEEVKQSDIDNLRDAHVDIVVSHTCPFRILNRVAKKVLIRQPINIDYSERLLDFVLDKYNPSIWFFGHWHGVGHFRTNHTKFYLLDMIRKSQLPQPKQQYRIIKEK